MLGDYFKLGLRNLRQRGLRSWLTMIGIFIGIAAVVSIIALGQGMQEAIVGQFTSLGTETITIQAAGGGFGPPGSYQARIITEDDKDVISQVRGVESAFGRLIESVTVEVDGKKDFGYIVSISDDLKEYEYSISIPTEFVAEQGRLIKPGDGCKIHIGSDLATRDVLVRKLKLGDKIILNDRAADVVGILKKTGNPQFDGTIFATEECTRLVTKQPEKYGIIVAKVQKGEDVELIRDRIEKDLRKSRNVELGKEDFVVETSKELIESLNKILGTVTWVLIGLASISLLVGGVGITNTMYTAVLERTKEIGIMKAIGARNSDVLKLFLIESGLLGMAGGIIGVTLGMGIALLMKVIIVASGFDLIGVNFSPLLIFGSLAFSFFVGALSGIMPARQAASMKPVEALAHG